MIHFKNQRCSSNIRVRLLALTLAGAAALIPFERAEARSGCLNPWCIGLQLGFLALQGAMSNRNAQAQPAPAPSYTRPPDNSYFAGSTDGRADNSYYNGEYNNWPEPLPPPPRRYCGPEEYSHTEHTYMGNGVWRHRRWYRRRCYYR